MIIDNFDEGDGHASGALGAGYSEEDGDGGGVGSGAGDGWWKGGYGAGEGSGQRPGDEKGLPGGLGAGNNHRNGNGFGHKTYHQILDVRCQCGGRLFTSLVCWDCDVEWSCNQLRLLAQGSIGSVAIKLGAR